MRLILTILFIWITSANATNYYVSNTGSDAAAGTSTGTAWQHISKVNSSSFVAGDSILFQAGGTWNEMLNITWSGTLANPIVFSSYGSGLKPIITGYQSQAGFTNVGNIWTATATNAAKKLNNVLINGNQGWFARIPNTGYYNITAATASYIKGGTITGSPNYTGASVVIRTVHWVLDILNITSQSVDTLFFSPAATYTPAANFGYWIQNVNSALDVAGEFTYDSTSKTLKVYATSSPTVRISTIDTLVQVNGKNYLTFNNLSFTGSNKSAINIDTTRSVVVKNCSFMNNGAFAISGQSNPRSYFFKDSMINTLSTAINLRTLGLTGEVFSDSSKVDSCYFKNTGYIGGMNQSGNGQCMTIDLLGNRDTITNNRIDSSGYIPIYINGQYSLVAYNYVTNFNFVKDDGGGVYTWAGNGVLPPNVSLGTKIRSNIIVNGIGATAGTSGVWVSPGTYLDIGTTGVTVDSNTIIDCNKYGMYSDAGTSNNTFRYNLVSNSIGYGFTVYNDGTPSGIAVYDNVFYVSNNAQVSIIMYDSAQSFDYNHYLRPSGESTKMVFQGYGGISFPSWQSVTPYDDHGQETPSVITSSTPTLYYNPTRSDTTITLSAGNYIDSRNWPYYSTSFVLHGFQSALLFPSTAPPVYYIPRKQYRGIIQK